MSNESNREIDNLVRAHASRRPETAAALAKIVKDPRQAAQYDSKGRRLIALPSNQDFKHKLMSRSKKNADNKIILRLLPDMALGLQIIVSAMLSPGDMLSTNVTLSASPDVFSSNLTSTLTDMISEHLEKKHQFNSKLYDIIYEAIGPNGAYPVAVFPESVVDRLINGEMGMGMESAISQFYDIDLNMMKPVGILGSPEFVSRKKTALQLSMESGGSAARAALKNSPTLRLCLNAEDTVAAKDLKYFDDKDVTVTDNYLTFLMPRINEAMRKKTVARAYSTLTGSLSMESISHRTLMQKLQTERRDTSEMVRAVPDYASIQRRSIGEPLVIRLPTESVLMVHVPGDVTKQIGAFVLIDAEGNPIRTDSDPLDSAHLSGGFAHPATNSLTSNLINKVRNQFGQGIEFNAANTQHIDYIAAVYADMVERDLLNRITNGANAPSSVKISANAEIYRVMLSRSLMKKQTQLLYVPIEFLTYITFDYDDDGVGKGLLDDIAFINYQRIILMYAGLVGAVKNSIGRTRVKISVDELDASSDETIELVKDLFIRSRNINIPLEAAHPNDIMDWLNKAGIEWEVTSEGEGVAKTKVEVEKRQDENALPDPDLVGKLNLMAYQGLYLTQEMLDTSTSSDFAKTIASNDLRFAKRTIMWQDCVAPQLCDYAKKLIIYNHDIYDDLVKEVEENLSSIKDIFTEEEKKYIESLPQQIRGAYQAKRALNSYMDTLKINLPRPASASLEQQAAEFQAYTQAVTSAIEAYLSSKFMVTDTAGEVGNQVDTIAAMLLSHFQRRYMADKGYLPELSELVSKDDNGNPQLSLMREITAHVEAMTASCVQNLSLLYPMRQAADKDLERLQTEGEAPSSSEDDSESSNGAVSDSGGDFGMGFGGGGDEFGAETENTEDTGASGTVDTASGGDEEEVPAKEPDL